ncbi:MAG TPA: hypothetical protein VLS92_04280, partial [Acidimicrobiia bacterium]|nr:hypothetical protein [Acidimicrobiia bacterium]
VDWEVTVAGEYPVTIFVQRLDNGAGSRILIDPVEIAGDWAGILTLTEVLVPEGTTLPDGTPVEPGWHAFDEVLACADEFGEELEQGMAEAIEQMREGVPITLTFTGTLAEPGTVVLSAQDQSTQGVSVPWRMEGGSIVFEAVDEDSYAAFSLTPAGNTMSGSFGVIGFDEEGDTEMRGTISLTKVGE